MVRTTKLARAQDTPWIGTRLRVILVMLGLFCFALAPRAAAVGTFVTADEGKFWFERTTDFLVAIQEGDFAATNQVGHPGVTTMWLGSLGVLTQQFLTVNGLITSDDPMLQLIFLRLPVALATALCVALAYPLLLRLLDKRVALLAALLWAADPFLVAHSQVLHLDALLASFMSLALLAAMVACGLTITDRQPSRRMRWVCLVGSAIAGGLAFLTKSPAALLVPMVGLIALFGCWQLADKNNAIMLSRCFSDVVPLRQFSLPSRVVVRRAVWVLLAWCSIAAAVWIALWPAAWVDLPGAIMSVVREVITNGQSVHSLGNFFLGHIVETAGPLFYVVAIALRLTPWVFVCLILAVVAAIVSLRKARHNQQPVFGGQSAVIGVLAFFVIIFIAAMSVAPKQFDRYVLPVFPALNIIAAFGWFWLVDRAFLTKLKSSIKNLSCVWALVIIILGFNLAWYHPYAFAYYNPLLGGGPVAARAMYVGWGEGLEQASAYISQQFNGCDRPVAAWYETSLQHFVCTPAVPLRNALLPGNVDYAVLYINQLQRGIDWEVVTLLNSLGPPLHTVRIHGIDYAHVYQIPQPVVTHPLEADFGPAIHFRGYDLDMSAIQSSGVISLTVQWQAQAPIDQDYKLFVHVLDANGQLVGQTDVPLGDPRAPTSVWETGQYIDWTHPVPVSQELQPGIYWIALGVYDPQDFTRLPLRGPTQPGAPSNGPDALLLEQWYYIDITR